MAKKPWERYQSNETKKPWEKYAQAEPATKSEQGATTTWEDKKSEQKISPAVANAFDVSRKGKEYQKLYKNKSQEINNKMQEFVKTRVAELQPLAKNESDVAKLNQQLHSEVNDFYKSESEKANSELKSSFDEFQQAVNSPFSDPDFAKGFRETYTPEKQPQNWSAGNSKTGDAFATSFLSTLSDQVPGGMASATAGRMTTDFDSWLVYQKSIFNPSDYYNPQLAFERRKKEVVDNYIKEVGQQQYQKDKEAFTNERITDKETLLKYASRQRGEAEGKMHYLPKTWGETKGAQEIAQYLSKNIGQVAGLAVPTIAASAINPTLGGAVGFGVAQNLEKGEAFEEGIKLLESNTGLTRKELFQSDADKLLRETSSRSGLVNGALEYLGTITTVGKLVPKNYLAQTIASLSKYKPVNVTVGAFVEGLTEWLQAKDTHYAAMLGAGKSSDEALKYAMSQDDSEEFIAGITGGGGLSIISNILESDSNNNFNGINNEPGATGAAGETITQTTGQPVQPNAEGQIQQGSESSVQQNTTQTGPTDAKEPAAVLKENNNLQPQPATNEQGTEISQRSAQEELRGSEGLHSQIQEAATFITRGVEAAKEKQQGQLSREQIEDAERQSAFEYAQQSGKWIDVNDLGQPFEGGGNENTLTYDEKEGVIYKSNNLFNSKNSLSQYFEVIEGHNEVFPENQYEFVGFTGVENKDKTPYVEPVVKQDYIPNAEQASQADIDALMEAKGFEKINDTTFKNEKYTVSDLRPRNVLKDPEGNIHVIDDIVTLNKQETSDEQGNQANPETRGVEQKKTGIQQEDAEGNARGIQKASSETPGIQKGTGEQKVTAQSPQNINSENKQISNSETPKSLSDYEKIGSEILEKYGPKRLADWIANQPLLGGFNAIRDIANKAGIKFPQTQSEFDAEIKKAGGIDFYMKELKFSDFYIYFLGVSNFNPRTFYEKQNSEIDNQINDLNKWNRNPENHINFVSKRTGYKKVTESNKNKIGTRDYSDKIGQYYYSTGASIQFKSAENLVESYVKNAVSELEKSKASERSIKVHEDRVAKIKADSKNNIQEENPNHKTQNQEEQGSGQAAGEVSDTQNTDQPDLIVGNYLKKNGSWFFTNKDGNLEQVLDLSKPVSESKGQENSEITELKKIRDQIKESGQPKPINQAERERIKNLDRTTITSRVRGFFLDGGKIRWNEEVKGARKKRGTKQELGYKEDERKSLIGIQSKNGLTPEEIGEQLAQQYDEKYSDQDYKDAVIDLLSTDRADWFADQRNEIAPEFGIEHVNKEIEINAITERISELEAQEYALNQHNKELYENERRVYRVSAEEGSGIRGQTPQTEGTKPDAAARIRENGNPTKSEQAREELEQLTLTRVRGLGMGMNQAKGAYVSTEKAGNRYATKDKPAIVAKATIANPFVADSHVFAEIQREAIQERFGKQSIDDITEAEADLLAEMMSEYFVKEGYDSIYFPESESQEGELIVFDRKNVSYKTRPDLSLQDQRQASESTGTESDTTENVSQKPETDRSDQQDNQGDEPPVTNNQQPETSNQDQKIRTIAKRYLNDPDVSDEVKSGLSQDGKYYIPATDLKSQAEADAYIEEKGIDQAMDDITDPDNAMSDRNRVFIGKTLYKLLKEEIQASENPDVVRDKLNRLLEDVAKMGTRAGQTVQAFANMFTSDADQVAYSLKKEYDRQRNNVIEQNEPQLASLQSLIDQATDEALRDLLNDPRIKKLIEESRANENTRQSKRKQFTKRILDKLDEIEKQIDESGKNNLYMDVTFGLAPLAYKAAINVIRAAVKAGDSLIDAVEKAIAEVNLNNKNWDEDGFRKLFESEIKEETKRDRKTLLEVLSQSGDTFKSLAQAHYKNYSGKKKSIQQLLQDELGLEAQEAERLGKTLDKIVGEKRQKLIESKFGSKIKTPKAKRVSKTLADKIEEFTNLGVLSDKNMREAYLSAIDLPAITDQQAAVIEKMVQDAEAKPNGFARYEAIQDIIKYHQKITPLNWMEVTESIWYANMLSGISTQSLNFQANSVATIAETLVSIPQSLIEYKNPKAALRNFAFMLKGLSEGYKRNLLESANVLKNGYQPMKGGKFDESSFRGVKTSKGSVLETLDNPLKYWKYVGRLMAATDILFYGGLKGMRAHQLAFRNAYNQNLNTVSSKMIQDAERLLGETDSQLNAAKVKAESEGFTGRDLQRRIYEIMEQSQPDSMREDANSFAAKGTYNYEPEGVLGVATGVINHATSKLPLLKTVVPFSRVISNVLNDYLNYTPWGLVRAAKGGMGIPGKGSFKRFTQEELLREKIKGIVGTSAMVVLYALTASDDDDEPLIQITADGTGNLKKNYELGETGWTQYSFKIRGTDKWVNYQNTSLAIPFATIGYIRDAEKYKGENVSDEKLGMILSGVIHYVTDMSFVSGLSDFFEILTSKDIGSTSEKLAMFANRTVKTAVVPNLFTQVSRGIQEVVDSPMKRGDGLFGQYVRDIPVLRDVQGTMYNALGEPIITETLYKFNPFITRFTSEADEKKKESHKLWELIVENEAYIGSPSKSTKIYDPGLGIERKLTDDEYERFALKAGQNTRQMLLNYYPSLVAMKNKSMVKKQIEEIKTQARERAKLDLFSTLINRNN